MIFKVFGNLKTKIQYKLAFMMDNLISKGRDWGKKHLNQYSRLGYTSFDFYSINYIRSLFLLIDLYKFIKHRLKILKSEIISHFKQYAI